MSELLDLLEIAEADGLEHFRQQILTNGKLTAAEADKRILQERNTYLEGTLEEYKQYLRNFGKLRDESQAMLDAVFRALEVSQVKWGKLEELFLDSQDSNAKYIAERDALAQKVQQVTQQFETYKHYWLQARFRSGPVEIKTLDEWVTLWLGAGHITSEQVQQLVEAERMGEVASKKGTDDGI